MKIRFPFVVLLAFLAAFGLGSVCNGNATLIAPLQGGLNNSPEGPGTPPPGGVVGCVAPAIPGFGGFDLIFDGSSGQVDGPMTGPNATAEIDIDHATGIVDDGNSHLFIPDGNGGVRKVDLNVDPPVMSTIIGETAWSAGGGSTNLSGIALLSNGDIIVSDGSGSVIWRVTQAGAMSVFAGTLGTSGFQDGPLTQAQFSLDESGLTVDPQGVVYVADDDNCAVRKIAGGQVTTVAGSPSNCTFSDGPVATAGFENPTGVSVDCNGNVVVSDADDNRIRRIVLAGPNAGTVVTVAGNGNGNDSIDNTDPLQADFSYPIAISVDSANNIIVSDHSGTFRRIAAGQNTPGADGTAANGAVSSPLGYEQPGSPLEYIAYSKSGNPVLIVNSQRIALTHQ